MNIQQEILIVDDKEENIFALERVLEKVDTKIVSVKSGNDALIATLDHDFALAIIDVQMPGMDGYELAEILRFEDKTKNLPLIFLTAVYMDEHHIFRGYEAGAVDFITKPFNPIVLLSKVKVFLQLDEQKRALLRQIELEKAKNYLENILAAVSDAILVVSLDAVIETVNKAALELLGYGYDELIGMPVKELFFNGDLLSWISMLRKAHESGNNDSAPLRKVETELVTIEKKKVPVLLSSSALFDQNGSIRGVVLAAVDITDRILAERKLKQYSEQLAERVDERTKELRETQALLIKRERLAVLGQLAGSVSHELRNPLGVISNAIYYLNLVFASEFDEDVKEYLALMKSEINIAERIIEELLDFGREKTAQRSQTEIAELIEKCNIVNPVPKNIDMQVDISPRLPHVFVDSDHILQILNNLVSNAYQAMPEGGDLFIQAQQQGKQVVISLKDTGVGIPPENIEKLFEPLFTTKARGIGLGLPICRNLAILNDASIEVFSAGVSGKGSTFILRLPIQESK